MATKVYGKNKVRVAGIGNHEPGWEPKAADVPTQAIKDFEAIGKTMALKPTQADMTAIAGPPVDEGKTLRWSIDRRKNPQAWQKWKEASAPHRRAEIERSYDWNNSHRKVQVVDPKTGRRELVFEEHEDTIGRLRGLRRDRPFSGMPRIEAGPDGMVFKESRHGYRWQPTGHCFPGALRSWMDRPVATSPQRDPDGETWVEIEGAWRRVALSFTDDECTCEFVGD